MSNAPREPGPGTGSMMKLEHVELLVSAIRFATTAHHGQMRSGTSMPYIVHPMEVMRILINFQVDEPCVLCAAVLHDVVEDTDRTLEDVERRFGTCVRDLVAHVTDDPALSKKENREKKLAEAPYMPWGAKFVRMADVLSNVRATNATSPAGWSASLKRAYLKTCEKTAKACSTNPLPQHARTFQWMNEVLAFELAEAHLRLDRARIKEKSGRPPNCS